MHFFGKVQRKGGDRESNHLGEFELQGSEKNYITQKLRGISFSSVVMVINTTKFM